MKVVAVDGQQFSAEALNAAIDAAKGATTPIRLLVANGAQFQTYSIDYHSGVACPHLERDTNRPDYLSEILRPLAPQIETQARNGGR